MLQPLRVHDLQNVHVNAPEGLVIKDAVARLSETERVY